MAHKIVETSWQDDKIVEMSTVKLLCHGPQNVAQRKHNVNFHMPTQFRIAAISPENSEFDM